MSKRQILMVLGIWIAVFLFLGFPGGWDKAFALISGLIIAGLAYSVGPKAAAKPPQNVPYVEHRAATNNQPPARPSIDSVRPDSLTNNNH